MYSDKWNRTSCIMSRAIESIRTTNKKTRRILTWGIQFSCHFSSAKVLLIRSLNFLSVKNLLIILVSLSQSYKSFTITLFHASSYALSRSEKAKLYVPFANPLYIAVCRPTIWSTADLPFIPSVCIFPNPSLLINSHEIWYLKILKCQVENGTCQWKRSVIKWWTSTFA